MKDFLLVDHGSIFMLTPLSNAAKRWLDENLSEEQTWFGRSLAIEPRYIENLIDGIQNSNLEIVV